MSSVEARLTELGSTLPTPPAAAGAYVPAVRTGNLLYLAGTLPMKDGKVVSLGKVGREVDIVQAAEAAKLCVLNALANAKAALGSLDRIAAAGGTGHAFIVDTSGDVTAEFQAALAAMTIDERDRHEAQ